jgi:group I intron endonuclease
MVGIYKITSPTNKVYIGQSWQIEHRFRCYRLYLAPSQQILDLSFRKHGYSNHVFEIIHELPEDVSQDVLNNYEQLYMDAYRGAGFLLMNIREAGSKGRHSEDTKRKMSEAQKGKIISEAEKQRLRKRKIVIGKRKRN